MLRNLRFLLKKWENLDIFGEKEVVEDEKGVFESEFTP
jgi:hypothetical protein